MPTTRSPLRRLGFVVVVILLSSLVWIASWEISQSVLSFTVMKDSVTLIYIPAGVRLVILLVSGIWGAIGIMLAFPVELIQVFPDPSWREIIVYSVIAGVIPYATVLAVCRWANVSRDLRSLRAIHLPLIAAAVSITGAASYAAALVRFGRFDAASFLPDVTAMMAGDFLGCFAVVLLVRLVIAIRRPPR
ncbi:hypothetical protein DK847_02245 [Aestuariivirga litoralis]|uniref:Uncharacterized protein n=1 Tax=Aestuariivirga litoralis TaxID=2650924 RepID=A0A2W2BYV8_9HYPH|nr:hypothetical protein [Aestuariivirga litoralis]PZF78646.1 hypothetical protein DK847_02245 [Aestuariivirga litoralis]